MRGEGGVMSMCEMEVGASSRDCYVFMCSCAQKVVTDKKNVDDVSGDHDQTFRITPGQTSEVSMRV